MSGYRFCRTDDVPLLVEAYDRCYARHVPDAPPLTEAGFKAAARQLGLWASSCMLAVVDDAPVGVLLAAKRETESQVLCIGIHPDHRRRGHGRHLLDSLSQKAAILGPPRLLAEIPDDLPEIAAFFESCGYRRETTFADFVLDSAAPTAAEITALAAPVSAKELIDAGAIRPDVPRSWERTPETLATRNDELEGLAVASDERVEAFVLLRRDPRSEERQIVALGGEGEHGRVLAGMLVGHAAAVRDSRIAVHRLSEQEMPFAALESWGFRLVRRYGGYATHAGSG